MGTQCFEPGYTPRNHTLKLTKSDADAWGICNGWSFNGFVAVKAKTTGCQPKREYTRWPDKVTQIMAGASPMLPVLPVGTACFDPEKCCIPGHFSLWQSGDHQEVYKADHLDIVHTAFPGHSAAMTPTGEYVATAGDQVVAIVCPYRNVSAEDVLGVVKVMGGPE